jgi:OmpA family
MPVTADANGRLSSPGKNKHRWKSQSWRWSGGPEEKLLPGNKAAWNIAPSLRSGEHCSSAISPLPWKNENEAEKLARAAGILIAYPGLNIAVGGYTDNVGGGDEMNQKLSETRAGGVCDYLVQPGVGGGQTQ